MLALSWALMPRPRSWKPFVLVASYVFYGAADPRFCLLLALITLVNRLGAVRVSRAVAFDLGDTGAGLAADILLAALRRDFGKP